MKLSVTQARRLGLKLPRHREPKAKAPPKEKPSHALFLALCQAAGLPRPVAEVAFAKSLCRRWRFDWLFDEWLALEVEGGAWTNGRHTRGQGFTADMEKYNAAACLGYVVVRCVPADIESGAACELVKRAMGGGS